MKNNKILWIDDEIDLLQSHIIFLKEKGYEISYCNNGNDALQLINENLYDIDIKDTESLLRSSLNKKIIIRKVNYSDTYKNISLKKITEDIISSS